MTCRLTRGGGAATIAGMMDSRGWVSALAAGLFVMGACTGSKVPQGEASFDSGDGGESPASTAGGTTSAGDSTASASTTGASTTSASTTGAGEGTTSAGEGTTSAGEGTTSAGETTMSAGTTSASSGGSDDLPEGCVGLDHSTCFDAMVAACAGQGSWNVTSACVDAVTSCYPMGTQVLEAVDIVGFCSAEIDGQCLYSGGPGCGETYCTCTAGGYPYDWNNCWHLLLIACREDTASDCESVLAGCYPGVSVEVFSTCQAQVKEDLGPDCNCAMCSIHEECKTALDSCLAS